MWHPQRDEAHGEPPTDDSPMRWLVPWVFPLAPMALGVAAAYTAHRNVLLVALPLLALFALGVAISRRG